MADAHIDLDWAAVTRLMRGPGGVDARHRGAEKVERAWARNIHRLTGVTEGALHISDGSGPSGGRTYVETGEAGPKEHEKVNLSAWYWLEYGTSKMRAKKPGARALARSAVK